MYDLEKNIAIRITVVSYFSSLFQQVAVSSKFGDRIFRQVLLSIGSVFTEKKYVIGGK